MIHALECTSVYLVSSFYLNLRPCVIDSALLCKIPFTNNSQNSCITNTREGLKHSDNNKKFLSYSRTKSTIGFPEIHFIFQVQIFLSSLFLPVSPVHYRRRASGNVPSKTVRKESESIDLDSSVTERNKCVGSSVAGKLAKIHVSIINPT